MAVAEIVYTFVRSNHQSLVPVSQYVGNSFGEAADEFRKPPQPTTQRQVDLRGLVSAAAAAKTAAASKNVFGLTLTLQPCP